MSIDFSRLNFDSRKNYAAVLMEQGRVLLDSDWYEAVAQLARRLQATAMDTFGPAEPGRAVVPSTTPAGFEITAGAGDFTIGRGRVYVDGLLVENHAAPAAAWDARLAELQGTESISFFAQPYLPFNENDEPAPANGFNRPELGNGEHLVYLDAWYRELTYLQDPDIVEKAVGVDTTARLQLVWQVRVLSGVGAVTCGTPDDQLEGWEDLIRPSGARLTTATADVPGDPNPCLVPPAAGYKGLENQLYRVEIHRGGPRNSATFKWSRDNATVAARVIEIQGGTRLVVDSLGRDDVLGFHAGEWVEVRDDWHELHALPGLLRRIRPGDGVDTATRSILFDDALPAGLFPVDGQGRTVAARNTCVRRWDQSHPVRRADGTVFHPLDASSSSDGIPVPPPGTQVALENGIVVEFDLEDDGEYRTGDHWVFAARTADGSIELLDRAPPRGIHHHYARLAVINLPGQQEDCRIHWPPAAGGAEHCDCTVCVHAEAHNAGTATIQQAIDFVRTRGGTVCLDAGSYTLAAPLNLNGVRSVRLRGQGARTLLQATQAGTLLTATDVNGLAIENLAVLGAVTGGATTALIDLRQCFDVTLSHLAVVAVGAGDATSAAIALSRAVFAVTIRDCMLAAERGIVGLEGVDDYLLTAHVRVTDCVLFCSQQGIRFAQASLHYGELRLSGNLVLACSQAGITTIGGALPMATVTIAGNVLQVTGTGVRAGTDNVRITDNELTGSATARTPADAIVLQSGLDPAAIDSACITGNRIRGFGGAGIVIQHPVGEAMIKSNRIQAVGGAAVGIQNEGSARYLCIENNHFVDIGTQFNAADAPYFGVLLVAAARADVVGNVFANVARQAIQPPLRVALGVQASTEARLAANRFFGIGPERFIGRTIAVAVATDFSQVAIDDNSVARIGESTDPVVPAPWQAIVVGFRSADAAGGGFALVPGVFVLAVDDDAVVVDAFRIRRLPARQRTASIRGNRVRSQAGTAPAIEASDMTGCLFNANDAELTGAAAGSAVPVARIRCQHVTAGHNRLIGSSDLPTLALDAPRFAAVGNITSGPIEVNGVALPAPWAALNVPA
jgi:hypothetical protein